MAKLSLKTSDKKISKQKMLFFVKKCYTIYGKAVVQQRALADFRDGLKPVHRRILWSMYSEGIHSTGGYKKAAKTTGHVLGNFHPHGALAIYESMVNMTSALVQPLIQGQGNWGDYFDPPAADRYCFAKGTLISTEYGLVPIEKIPEISGSKVVLGRANLNMTVESRNGPEKATAWVNSGVRVVYNIKTNVSSVKATDNEPFLVLSPDLTTDWKTVENLQVGDYLCIQRNPKILWPSPGKKMIQVNAEGSEYSWDLPKHMSPDLAEWMGLVLAEGSMRYNTINFGNSDSAVIERYKKLCKKLFTNKEAAMHWVEPDKYPNEKVQSTKPYCQINLNDQHIGRWLEANNVPLVTSHFKRIPSCILQAGKDEVVAFLRGLFEGDGSNNIKDHRISYSSRSKGLLKDIQTLLLSKFGIPFTLIKHAILLTSPAYYSKFMLEIGFISDRKNEKVAKIPTKYARIDQINYIADLFKNNVTHGRRGYLIDENGAELNKFSMAGLAVKNINQPPASFINCCEWLSNVADIVRPHYPTLVAKLEQIIANDYIMVPVLSKKRVKKEVCTYDLTVPANHAFTANGFIVHNTEARLSKFSDKFMLNPEYMKVCEFHPTYDWTGKEPLYLPALLPNLLFNGSSGIAVGVTASIPAFEPKGVLHLVKRALSGKEVTPGLCARHLVIKHRNGSHNVSTDEEYMTFFEAGAQSLQFGIDYEVRDKSRQMVITGITPSFSIMSTIKKLEKLKEFQNMRNMPDKTHEHQFVIQFKTSVETNSMAALCERVYKLLFQRQSYKTNVTLRLGEDDVKFAETNIPKLIMDWAAYRIDLEQRMQKQKAIDFKDQIAKSDLLIIACRNAEFIVKTVRSDAKDPKSIIMKRLNLDLDQVQYILSFTLQQISKLNEEQIVKKIKGLEASYKVAIGISKMPEPKCVADMDEALTFFK